MAAYYNEHDPYPAEWLRRLIARNLIAPGEVDERSIVDVSADDVRGFDQCHWFAGIAGWSLALRWAGVADDRSVWTGSCPCQPFSVAGKGDIHADERHLWPAWFRLIRECRPAVLFGEQVASPFGRAWLDHVLADMEDIGYAAAAADLPVAGVGAPHIRQRLWFVAHADQGRLEVERAARLHEGRQDRHDAAGCSEDGFMGHPKRAGLEGFAGDGENRNQSERAPKGSRGSTAAASAWSDVEWRPCSDGKARPTQPGVEPLATGIPGRVGRLRAYGNSIAPPLGAAFIMAALDCLR
jgi:DNA (cytosine-5)-methyltransferase 1